MIKYEQEFKEAVFTLKNQDLKKMVFGDIYLDEHKEWVERVCGELGVEPLEPLWAKPPEKIIQDFINFGFNAIVVSAKADIFEQNFVGRYIDEKFISELKQRKICPCGENGEFHTFVIDGPLFKTRIEITESDSILKEGFWKYWFLDIKKYQLKEKEVAVKFCAKGNTSFKG